MRVIILGDRFKKGLKSKGCPGLIKPDKITIFDHQFDILNKSYPNCEVVYISGYDSKRMRHFVKKNYQEKNITVLKNQDYDKFNDVQSLNVAADYLDQACLIMSGYLIPDPKLLENIPEQNSQVFLSKKENNVGCIVRDKKVSNISFGLPNYLQDIYYINREDILKIKPLVRMKSNQNCFFFEILNTIIDQNSTIYTNTEKPK